MPRKKRATTFKASITSCGKEHPALMLPGTDLVVYGGRASAPRLATDIRISFDRCMAHTAQAYPWTHGHEFIFPIDDMQAPGNPDDFDKLVRWAKEQLEAGLTLHAGCIGGHGRTGTFLAALVALYGEKDAVAYVRKNYCSSAVESRAQVDFLVKHYGVAPVVSSRSSYADEDWFVAREKKAVLSFDKAFSSHDDTLKTTTSIQPMRNVGSLWDVPL